MSILSILARSAVKLINAISFPAAQFGFIYLFTLLHFFPLENLCLIEILVVIFEFVLLRWVLGIMHRTGKLDQPVTAGRTFMMAFLSNLATFGLVFIGAPLFGRLALPFFFFRSYL